MHEIDSKSNPRTALKEQRTEIDTASYIGVADSIGFGDLCTLYRKTSCTCGGSCPSCKSKSALNISQPNDPAEIEAEQIADKVMRVPVDDARPNSKGSDAPHKPPSMALKLPDSHASLIDDTKAASAAKPKIRYEYAVTHLWPTRPVG